jgi:hypothetical protein
MKRIRKHGAAKRGLMQMPCILHQPPQTLQKSAEFVACGRVMEREDTSEAAPSAPHLTKNPTPQFRTLHCAVLP